MKPPSGIWLHWREPRLAIWNLKCGLQKFKTSPWILFSSMDERGDAWSKEGSISVIGFTLDQGSIKEVPPLLLTFQILQRSPLNSRKSIVSHSPCPLFKAFIWMTSVSFSIPTLHFSKSNHKCPPSSLFRFWQFLSSSSRKAHAPSYLLNLKPLKLIFIMSQKLLLGPNQLWLEKITLGPNLSPFLLLHLQIKENLELFLRKSCPFAKLPN